MIKFIECLNQKELLKCFNLVDSLKDDYQDLPEGFNFKTLGAATYLHYAPKNKNIQSKNQKYNKIKNKINPILMKNFGWLYDIIVKRLSDELKEPCQISEKLNLAFPGFHIFYPYEGCDEICHPPHLDYQWSCHLYEIQKNFKDVDSSRFLTFTLSIKLPNNGAGLYYWNLPDYNKNYSFEEAEEFFQEIRTSASTLFAVYNESVHREEYEKATNPSILDYKEGYMTIFTQPILHQIMPFNQGWRKDDIRITLQGHGIMCDKIWYLYF